VTWKRYDDYMARSIGQLARYALEDVREYAEREKESKIERSNAIGQRGAACGASAAPTGCASNGKYNERTEK